MTFYVNRNRPEPIFRQIRDYMREQILSGEWPEHYKLKPELELVETWGVNRGTLRKAIADLIDEGLLITVHGRGTFVASRMIEQPLAEHLVAFSEDLIKKGIPFETMVLEKQVVQPSQRVAALLSLPEPDARVLALSRVRTVQGLRSAVLRNYVVHARCPGIEAVDFSRQGLFATLEHQYRLHLTWGQRTFQAQVASPEIATLLDIAPGAPVMYLEQLTYTKDGKPIELSDIWLRGDRFRLSAIVTRDGDTRMDSAFIGTEPPLSTQNA